jgi:hypothetical protein
VGLRKKDRKKQKNIAWCGEPELTVVPNNSIDEVALVENSNRGPNWNILR